MELSAKVLGQSTARLLSTRASTPVLVIGTDKFSRSDLAHVACFNFIAAQTLSRLVVDLRVSSTSDLYQRFSPKDLALPRLGAIALAVLGAAFECKGLGTLESWAQRSSEKLVTFASIKTHSRDVQAERAERRARVARQRRRRAEAHRRRLEFAPIGH